jgi:large subunit ribosomal protein L15
MKMPFQVRKPAFQEQFVVNEDPEKLHRVYDRILGKDGWQALSEDTRWLAITHKSFDQGRRGFNARLSYLGMSDRENAPEVEVRFDRS